MLPQLFGFHVEKAVQSVTTILEPVAGEEGTATAGTIVVPPAPTATVRDGRLDSCVATGARNPAVGSTRNAHTSGLSIVLVATRISCAFALPGFAKLATKVASLQYATAEGAGLIGPAVPPKNGRVNVMLSPGCSPTVAATV